MKTKEEVREYLESHFFKNRRHAYAIRNIIVEIDEFKDAELNFRWANETMRGSSIEQTITSNDAIKFIFNEN